MNAPDFIPQDQSQLVEWLINFSKNLQNEGVALGITPAEIASLNALVFSAIEDIENKRSEEKESQKKSMLSFVRLIVNKMKEHPHYNIYEHGRRLRIED